MAIGPGAVLAMGITVFFLAAVLPQAFSDVFNANTTGWDASTVSLWELLPLAVIAGIVLIFLPGGSGD